MNLPKTFDNALTRVFMWNLLISVIAYVIFDVNNPRTIPAMIVCSLMIYSYFNLYACKCK